MDVPGEKLLTKLWETIADKGIGSLLKPWQMRREGVTAAEVQRIGMLALAQAEVDAASIRSGDKVLLPNGDLAPAHPPMLELEILQDLPRQHFLLPNAADVAQQNGRIEAIRREVSIAKAVTYAEAELAQDTQTPPAATMSADWLLRWRENAAGVSSEELQSLWGKVLAGEVKEPGRFTLRVLDFLKNLSQAEAAELDLLSRVATGDAIYRCDKALLTAGITPAVLGSMEELGILSGTGAMGLNRSISSQLAERYQCIISSARRAIVVAHQSPEKILQMPFYQLTKLGLQVLQLTNNEMSEDYLRELADTVKVQGFDVFIGNFAMVGATECQVTDMQQV